MKTNKLGESTEAGTEVGDGGGKQAKKRKNDETENDEVVSKKVTVAYCDYNT